jgi:hypothetical protein
LCNRLLHKFKILVFFRKFAHIFQVSGAKTLLFRERSS